MDCSVGDVSAFRTLSRAVLCASKVGEDVGFSSTSSGLRIRTVNASKSACGEFHFHANFFSRFACRTASTRVPARALLPILRAPASVSAARVSYDPARPLLVLRLVSKAGARKTFRIPVSEGAFAAPTYARDAYPSVLRARPRFLLDVLANFHARLDEITLAACAESLRVSSYVDEPRGDAAGGALLRTSVSVDPREFESFQVVTEPSLTFYCRPFRAVLEFCDALEASLSVSFGDAGRPLLATLDVGSPGAGAHFEATFLFATRGAPDPSPTMTGSGSVQRSGSTPESGLLDESGPRSVGRPKLLMMETTGAEEEAPPGSSGGRKRLRNGSPSPHVNPSGENALEVGDSGPPESSLGLAAGSPPKSTQSPVKNGPRESADKQRSLLDPESEQSPENIFRGKGLSSSEPQESDPVDPKDGSELPWSERQPVGSVAHIPISDEPGGGQGAFVGDEDEDDEFVEGTPPPDSQ